MSVWMAGNQVPGNASEEPNLPHFSRKEAVDTLREMANDFKESQADELEDLDKYEEDGTNTFIDSLEAEIGAIFTDGIPNDGPACFILEGYDGSSQIFSLTRSTVSWWDFPAPYGEPHPVTAREALTTWEAAVPDMDLTDEALDLLFSNNKKGHTPEHRILCLKKTAEHYGIDLSSDEINNPLPFPLGDPS